MFFLSLEASTTSAKAMLYNTADDSISVKCIPYPRMCDDALLHDPQTVFTCLMQAGRVVAAGAKVCMISLVNAWHSVMLCDKEFNPVTPIYPWTYTGANEICDALRTDSTFTKEYYGRTGCMVNATYPYFKLLMLREAGFGLQDYRIMGQGEYNTLRLTGKYVQTACMASGSGLLNIFSADYEPETLDSLMIGRDNLPELIAYNKTFPLNAEGARLLGLEQGIPVIAANSDGGMNQIGVGALSPGVMTLSIGTSGAIRLTAPRPKLPDRPSTWCYFSPKTWLSGAATAGCCNCIDWFRKTAQADSLSYNALESVGASAQTICDTPIFLPFLYGERCPGWNDKRSGGFIGVRYSHSLEDMYRGVQQGVLFNLYQCYQELARLNGTPKAIKMSGGILKSKIWSQMCADVFGVCIDTAEAEQSSLMGGIVLAMELTGYIADAALWQPDTAERLYPNSELKAAYQKQFERYLEYYEKQ